MGKPVENHRKMMVFMEVYPLINVLRNELERSSISKSWLNPMTFRLGHIYNSC